MSEEAKVVEPVVVEVAAPEPEVNPVEAQAVEQGWRPKEEWVSNGGDPDEWKPAKLFVKDGELYKSLHSQKRELRQTQAALSALQRHHQYVFDKAHQQALKDLKMERREALRQGEPEVLEAVENKIEELTTQYQKEKVALVQEQQQAAPATAEYDTFVERNPWYLTNSDLRDEADAAGFLFLNKGGSKDKLLAHVEKTVKQKYPEKFGVKRAAPSPTAAGDRTVRSGRSNDIELDEMEQHIMKGLVDSGTMTKAEYIAELKKAKGIK